MPVSTGHVAMRTRVQDWTCVRILMGPVITDHWTEAPPPKYSSLQRDLEGTRSIPILNITDFLSSKEKKIPLLNNFTLICLD